MFDHNSIMALKELVGGEQQEMEMVQNPFKGSMLNPGAIGGSVDDKNKQIAKPFAKIQAKIGQKYVPKGVNKEQDKMQESVSQEDKKPKISKKHEIWSQQEVAQLPILKEDPRQRPQFETFYRQKVGTQDVFLGMSGVDPSSNHCNQITYKIQLPNTDTKQIQLDLTDRQMVIQTKKFYLIEYFQYRVDNKKTKAKFIADKNILELILPIIRNDDF